MGFPSISEFARADEAGCVWVSSFRKGVASAATTTSGWSDYTYFAGSPVANFYASTPLAAALIEADKGIYTGGNVSPATKHIKDLILMSRTNGIDTASARQKCLLSDYLLYYPFIDTDAVGEEQLMDNTVTIPRYQSGQVVAVGQSASSAIGQFTFTYTNQDGVAGRVSPVNFTFVIGGGGQVVAASGDGASFNPFLYLQAGDTSVKSIESVNMSAGGGGLMALVIVKPLYTVFVQEPCSTTSGSAGACSQLTSIIHQAGAPKVLDGAVLGILAAGYGGSLASSFLVGTLEVAWG